MQLGRELRSLIIDQCSQSRALAPCRCGGDLLFSVKADEEKIEARPSEVKKGATYSSQTKLVAAGSVGGVCCPPHTRTATKLRGNDFHNHVGVSRQGRGSVIRHLTHEVNRLSRSGILGDRERGFRALCARKLRAAGIGPGIWI
jgi:hypothetical protein